ncbi:hypothetical protein CONCODRAFT_4104 [Conidiobolus coronatus NRRL 28638]|uniref:Uncharacterized protein n=1 Tax=Conidiobolus coronatus (strain ATCC 28846 / CBS 209.66 / NRRL 28638) TaxID=796925 RepID=A0A137PD71_CONC2|nr:hypothetical protein CONCODRAFT_4104 [Conidiobolus coronatus NRRL 28638]|eukprot:KXN72959.1 hypothetical protein CONCODRAFT_4104 [Conidiobolus coronatus NRRL 28638]
MIQLPVEPVAHFLTFLLEKAIASQFFHNPLNLILMALFLALVYMNYGHKLKQLQ